MNIFSIQSSQLRNSLVKPKSILIFGLTLLFFSTLYSQPNYGGSGLFLPLNVMAWLSTALLISITFALALQKKRIQLKVSSLIIVTALGLIFIIGLLNTPSLGVEHAVYGLGFLGAILFIISLDQFTFSENTFRKILWLAAITGGMQTLIGLIQIHDSNLWVLQNIFTYNPIAGLVSTPFGVFQQVNMYATFLAFSSITILYLLLNPKNTPKTHIFHKLLTTLSLLLSLIAMIYVISSIGSRAGILSLFTGFSLVLTAHLKKVLKFDIKVLQIIATIFIGVWLSQSVSNNSPGIEGISSKTERVVSGEDIRLWLYSSSWSGFLDAPVIGHGIGNLSQMWKSQTGFEDQAKRKPDLVPTLVHPHNEVLYWMNNSGVITLISFILIGSLFLLSLFNRHGIKAFEILGLMSPFLISAMVSRPFELAPILFLLLLFFIHYGFKNHTFQFNRLVKFKWESSIPKLIGVPFIIFVVTGLNVSAWFTLTSNKEVAEFEFYRDNHPKSTYFPKDGVLKKPFLQHAKYHPFFEYKTMTAMLALSEIAFEKGYSYDLLQYIHWANSREEYLESPVIVFNLLKSYLMLNKNSEAVDLYKKSKVKFLFNKNIQTIGNWMKQKGLVEQP